jgi:lincosamide nucleotidyltransferase A/C/D/E
MNFRQPLTSGYAHYRAHLTGEVFPAEALDGIGSISVRCETAEWSVRWHTGYPARPIDGDDVTRLCERFAIPVPEAFR